MKYTFPSCTFPSEFSTILFSCNIEPPRLLVTDGLNSVENGIFVRRMMFCQIHQFQFGSIVNMYVHATLVVRTPMGDVRLGGGELTGVGN